MITYKHITKIVIVIVAAALLFCLGSMVYADRLTEFTGGRAVFMEYESKLFDRDQIISVDIQIDHNDWEELLDHAIEETYYECDVKINDTVFSNVGVRAKGNTSLTSIANDPDTDRYSLKLEFDRYVEGQTCFGLDKLVLNNNYADATNMKEAIVYDMYQYLDADASLYNYAKVSVNGEYWGVYLALEAVEESFLLRNYGVETGELYKPENMDGDGKNQDGKNLDGRPKNPNGTRGAVSEQAPKMAAVTAESPKTTENNRGEETSDEMPGREDFSGGANGGRPGVSDGANGGRPDIPSVDNGERPNVLDGDNGGRPDIPGLDNGEKTEFPGVENGKGARSMGGGGSDLNYTDDEPDSYTTIWEGAVTDTTDADHKRVITALKQIHSGTNLEEYLNVDAVLKYMAVHTFSVNLDSLAGNMAHNYYLYESAGQLNILPWDYNLAFGGMEKGNNNSAAETVNYPIDTPFSGTRFFDALLQDETYLDRYHGYLKQLAEEYVQNKRFDTVYAKIRAQIDDLVKTDPTAFFTYEQYDAGASMLFETILLRAESIMGQLAGTIPSTDDAQRENPDALLKASEIDLSLMGEFRKGGRDFEQQNMEPPSDPKSDTEEKGIPTGEKTEAYVSKKDIGYCYGICGIILLLAMLLVRSYHRKKRYGQRKTKSA